MRKTIPPALDDLEKHFKDDSGVERLKRSLITKKKIFAMAFKSQLALKLPHGTIEELLQQGKARPLKMGARIMSEWASIQGGSKAFVIPLAKQAKDFVEQESLVEKSYKKKALIKAPVSKVYEALTTKRGLQGWWTPLVSGSTTLGGTLHFRFEGMDEYIDMKVVALSPDTMVEWQCKVHSSLPEWSQTTVRFDVKERPKHHSELIVQHIGLTANLTCYADCRLGWDHFIRSIIAFTETGQGHPFGGN